MDAPLNIPIIRPDLTEDFLISTGRKIHDILNFPLFNSRPSRKRVTWCYYELRERGYQPRDLEEPFRKIPEFFEKRTLGNQALLAQRMFGVEWNEDLASAMLLRYQQVEISEQQIEKTSVSIQKLLHEVTDLSELGMDSELFKAAVKMNYTLQHYEDFDEFSLDRLFDCLRETADRSGSSREVLKKLDQILEAINPAKKQVLTPAEVDWLLETVMVSTEKDLQLFRLEIKGMNAHPPELEKILRATESFNSLLGKARSGESMLSARAADRLRELIRKSAESLLDQNLKALDG